MLLLSRFIIQGHSMEPTIKNGEGVLASSIPYLFSKPKVGDVVFICHSGKPGKSVSRISLPLDENGRDSGVANAPQNDEDNNKYLVKRIIEIDSDKYFVKGDNKNDSMDSRLFGWVEKKEIVGKVLAILNRK